MNLKWQVFILFFFLYFFNLRYFSFALFDIIRAIMRQRTNVNKPSNINKIIILKSWWNQEMTPYTIFQKIAEFRVMQGPQFPPLWTFYIRKIQTFLRRCWLNTTIDSQHMYNYYTGLTLVYMHSLAFKRYTQIYAQLNTVIFIMTSMYVSQVLNNMKHKLVNVSWWWRIFGQNFKNHRGGNF